MLVYLRRVSTGESEKSKHKMKQGLRFWLVSVLLFSKSFLVTTPMKPDAVN